MNKENEEKVTVPSLDDNENEVECCEAAEDAESLKQCEIVYDKVEYDENGLIKRDGFKMKGVNYGPEFDQENLNKAFKVAIVGVFVMIILFACALCFFWNHFEPFIKR